MPPVDRTSGPASARPIHRPVPDRDGSHVHAALALCAVWALLFWPQIFAGRAFVIGDAAPIRAYAEFSQSRWREHGERTHWNPYIFAGIPATVSLQDSRPQWLPDVLLTAFDGMHRLPGFPPLAIPLVAHLAGMIGMAFLARELWAARTATMVWAGVAWGLLPNQLVPFAFGHDAQLMAGAMAPLMLLGVHATCAAGDARSRAGATLGLALAVASALLAAHPQYAVLLAPVVAAFAIERALTLRRPRALIDIALAGAAGVAMTAAIWWPARLYNAHSVRGAGMNLTEITNWSANGLDLLASAWPWAAGFGTASYWGGMRATDFPMYAGVGVVALAVFGLFGRDRSRTAAVVLAVTAVAGALLALGVRLGPAFSWMYAHVPMWSSFRVAINALLLTQIAVALLSARGLERLWDAAERAPRRVGALGVALALVGVAVAALSPLGLTDLIARAMRDARPAIDPAQAAVAAGRAASDLAMRTAALGAFLALAALSAKGPGWRKASHAAVPGLLALDLAMVGAPFLSRATGSLGPVANPTPTAVALLGASESGQRVLDLRREHVYLNDWMRWRARSITGMHPAVPRVWTEMWDSQIEGGFPMLGALAVKYIVVPGALNDSSGLERVATEAPGTAVWRLRQAAPRAYAVQSVKRFEDDRALLAAISAPRYDPRRDAVTVDEQAAGWYPGSSRCRVRWAEDEPDRIAIETDTDSAAFLVIADTWFPGWSATLDARPHPIHRVQHMLRGVAIPSGRHLLRMTYEPEGWREAVTVSRAAWTAWLLAAAEWGAALWLRRRSRGARAGVAPR